MPLPRLMVIAGTDGAAGRLTELLAQRGYPLCRRAGSAAEALHLAQREPPDIFLVSRDLGQDGDGINAAAGIRKRVDSPVILVAGRMGEGDVLRLKQASLHGCLLEPFEPAQIALVLDMATHAAEVERALRQGREQMAESLRSSVRQLEESNTALKVLMEHRDRERGELEQQVASNVRRLIMPALNRLRLSGLSREQAAWVDLVENGLRDITAPLTRKLTSDLVGLTPRELEVANLIRRGRSSRQIAVMLGVSLNSVVFHRQNIRAKLGLKNRKVNLTRHLRHMTEA